MKENGMEKLIELLNEREEIKKTGIFYVSYDDYDGEFYGLADDEVSEIVVQDSFVCSKKYGFIQWLVENDKIETNHLSLQAFKNIFSGGGFVKVSDLEVLLMLLSISDTPIEDLISYLK